MRVQDFNKQELKKLFTPKPNSHKGQNGKVMVIGGSKLFHAASLWPLKVASRMTDMVFYSSVTENNQIVQKAKEEFRDGIIVPRLKIEDYIEEADCILIGPGLPRKSGEEEGDDDTKKLTEGLLKKYPHKKWVIDGGSLQTIDLAFIPQTAILTPHAKEFETLFKVKIKNSKGKNETQNSKVAEIVRQKAEVYKCVVLLKGQVDVVSDGETTVQIKGGNAGMTKGGTGDVLAGLVAALYCKNSAFLSACAGSYINKKAGDELFEKVGYYFNTSDLVSQIPQTMRNLSAI
ncbi:NAD(P)H-hydrate dehydratase [Patescibacteria group bacterium]|nr:NAD(P)H-hydrate dehydratase [Patescibacteria group bacterium]